MHVRCSQKEAWVQYSPLENNNPDDLFTVLQNIEGGEDNAFRQIQKIIEIFSSSLLEIITFLEEVQKVPQSVIS